MKNFYEYLYKYGLHDCKVDDIIFSDRKIIFCFSSGVYELSSVGKETKQTKNCRMVVELEDIKPEKMWEHIEINKIINRKVSEISCDEFVNDVKKIKFDIDMHYYSYFCNTILLKGYINNGQYEVKISEVKNIEFK